MKLKGIVAALMAAGLALAPPARADDVDLYLEVLHERGITHNQGDGTLVQIGQQICDQISYGRTPLSVTAELYRETPASISVEDAGYIVGAAIGGLCPEYVRLITR